MTEYAFSRLHNFSLDEHTSSRVSIKASQDIKLIELELMLTLDRMTWKVKEWFKERSPACIIHHITSGTHTPTSQHPLGRAVDCYFTGLGLYEMVMIASLLPWTGIGFYPYSIPAFVHLDVKDLGNQMIRRLWYRDTDGMYVGFNDIQDVIHKLRGRHWEGLEENIDP